MTLAGQGSSVIVRPNAIWGLMDCAPLARQSCSSWVGRRAAVASRTSALAEGLGSGRKRVGPGRLGESAVRGCGRIVSRRLIQSSGKLSQGTALFGQPRPRLAAPLRPSREGMARSRGANSIGDRLSHHLQVCARFSPATIARCAGRQVRTRHANRASMECCRRALCSRARSRSAAMLCVLRSCPTAGAGPEVVVAVVVGCCGGEVEQDDVGDDVDLWGGGDAGGDAGAPSGGGPGDAGGVDPSPTALAVVDMEVGSMAQQSCPLSFSAASMDFRCIPACVTRQAGTGEWTSRKQTIQF